MQSRREVGNVFVQGTEHDFMCMVNFRHEKEGRSRPGEGYDSYQWNRVRVKKRGGQLTDYKFGFTSPRPMTEASEKVGTEKILGGMGNERRLLV